MYISMLSKASYPLIHNSSWLRDAGYFYPDFDEQEGRPSVAARGARA